MKLRQIVQQNGKKVDVAESDLPYLCKSVVKLPYDLKRKDVCSQRPLPSSTYENGKLLRLSEFTCSPEDPPSAVCAGS